MNLSLQEKLRFQKQAGIITLSEYNRLMEWQLLYEEVSDDDIVNAVASALKISPDQVATNEPNEEEIDESVIGTIAAGLTIAGLVPVVLKLVGGLVNKTKEKFGLSDEEKVKLNKLNKLINSKEKYIESLDKKNSPKEEIERSKLEQLLKQKDEQFGAKLGNWAKHAAHDVHEAYTFPIKKFLESIAWTSEKFGKKSKFSDEKTREVWANIIYSAIMIWAAGYGIVSHIKHLAGVGPVITTIIESLKGGKSIAEVIKDALLLV
jgi:hypothetical protein